MGGPAYRCICGRDFLSLPGFYRHRHDVHGRGPDDAVYRSPFAGRR